MFIVGILFFGVVPGLESGTLISVLVRSALLGLITYATYDLTNLATVKDWPVPVTMVAMLWGTAPSGAVSYVALLAGQWRR